MQPRLIRLRDVPTYLGMDINRFNTEVRPQLIAIPIGKQGIAFDRLDLDHWFEQYKASRECPKQVSLGGNYRWEKRKPQVSTREIAFGTLEKQFLDAQFAKVQKLAI